MKWNGTKIVLSTLVAFVASCGANETQESQASDVKQTVTQCESSPNGPIKIDGVWHDPRMVEGKLIYYPRTHQGVVARTAQTAGKVFHNSFQQIAQARANAMARLGYYGHDVHKYNGVPRYPGNVQEGIGWSSGGLPPTCRWSGRVVADATARGSNGRVYRVRFYQGGQRISSGR